jgi:sporulation protein YlmC with PRC-barrel domain
MIEAGWEVVDGEGKSVGKVHDVVGDTGKDIFNGLAVSAGLLKPPRYVPAERVGTIVEGRVELDLDREEFERLEAYEEPPPSEQVRPDTTGL